MIPSPRISLAVIVRNDAQRLEKLLTGHAALWEEAVVVDTGSGDDSVAAALDCGARVLQRPWDDDFSAARNHGLAGCRGAWVLVLDCDECIAASDFQRVRDLAQGEPSGGWLMSQWNYADDSDLPDWRPTEPRYRTEAAGSAGYVPSPNVRLFPVAPAVRYSGLIHETVEPALARLEWPVRRSEIVVHHQGHRDGGDRHRVRLLRNGRLLRRNLREHPTDPVARRQMAVQLIQEGHRGLATDLLARTVAESPGGPEVARARRLLARLHMWAGESKQAVAEAEAALRERPDWPDAWLDTCRLLTAVGDQNRANFLLTRGQQLFPLDTRFFSTEVSSF